MNKNLYRIVFNKARGMLMVVADIAKSGRASSSPSSGVGHTLSQRISKISLLNFSLLLALGCVSLTSQAGIVADGSAAGNQQPTIINSANGTPQVNIQTPNSQGVSHNKYSQFDVDSKGVILNNSHNATQTQLGGMVNGNPWLAKSEAKIILNEVNSRNPSQLNGVLEVAGKKAQIVIANPAGITCDGCGFINANRTTLTTGTPQFNNGQISGYDVNQGEIVIQGRGLDSTGQDSTDIIARAVKVNAGIWANELNVTAGRNLIDAAHQSISPKVSDASPRPQLAVDVAQIGGMYAGKIRLIGTETGVGVHNAGTIGTSAGSVTLTADGCIENSGTINSVQDLTVSSSGGIQNSGTQYASGNTRLTTQADVTNSGTLAAAGETTITAGSLNSTNTGVLAAGLNSDGKLGSSGNLTLSASGTLSAHGQNLAASNIIAQGSSVDLSQSQTWGNQITATATTGNLSTAQGNIAAAQTLTLNTNGLLTNDGGKLEAQRLLLGGSSLSNQSGVINQLGEQDLTLAQSNAINNTEGTIASNGTNLTLNTAKLTNNKGSIIHAGSGKLTLNAADLEATSGMLATNGALSISGKKVVLDSATTQADNITLTADTLSHRSGKMAQTGSGNMAVTVVGGLDNTSGSIASNGDFVLKTGSLINQQGQLLSAGHALTLTSVGAVDNRSGFIAADSVLELNSSQLNNNSGLIQSGSLLTLDTHGGELLNQNSGEQGGIISMGDLSLKSGNVDNQHGTIYSAGTATLSTGSWNNTAGQLAGVGSLNYSGSALFNDNGGLIQSGSEMRLDTHGAALSNAQNGVISSQGDLHLNAGDVNNHSGTVYSAANAVLSTGSWNNTAGLLAGVSSLSFSGNALLNDNGGAVQSGGDLLLDTHGALLSNTQSGDAGGITSQGKMQLNVGNFDNMQGAVISNQQLALNANDVNNESGLLVALKGLDASTATLNNHNGAIQSGAAFNWNTHGNSLNNANGLISAQDAFTLLAGDINNQQGLLTSGGDFTLTAGQLDNRNGQVAGKSDLTLTTSGINNQHGALQALGDMALNAANAVIDNSAGLIQSAQQVLMNAAQVLNQNTHSSDTSMGIQGGNIAVNAYTLNNQNGDMLANEDLVLSLAGDLDNRNGLITAMEQAQIYATAVLNSQGDIEAGQALGITSNSLTGDGKLLSLGDMSLTLASDFTNTSTIQANGNLDFTTPGNVTNQNLMQAGDTFTLNAASLNNTVDGELSAGTLDLRIAGTLTNRGLLDGYDTRLTAQTLNNIGTGRVYGDWLAIDARILNNSAENGTAATIAARQQLDIGVGTLNNSDHALIYSDGNLFLGGSLNSDWLATGQAGVVNNHSATIESAGNMTLNVATLNNINDHFTTENVVVSQEHISEYLVDRLGSQLYNDNDYDISIYKDETWIICIEGVLCHNTAGDKFTHFDYTRTITEDRVQESDPGQIIAGGNLTINAGNVLNDKSQIVAGNNLNINAANLNNVEVNGERKIIDDGTSTRYTRKQSKGGDSPKVSVSDYTPPAIIQAISLNSSTVADHSQITGSGLTVDAHQDTSVSGSIQGAGNLGITEIAGPDGAGFISTGPLGGVTIPTAGKTFEVALTGSNEVIRMVGPNTRIPDNSLFKSHPESNSPYLIETDPRFTNQKLWLGSDYMMKAFTTDPNNIQKRLGDGFYEQRLIREQVVALTGQRYLGGTSSDEEQYKMLMDNGIAFGQKWGLKPGVALTPEQMSSLTTDIVWMVTQTVKMPDGSTQQVLVPQVYAKVKPGDLDGSGALLAGKNVILNLSGDLTNSGRISAKDSTQILANNINNLGGIISGNDVALQARTDI
ncbi:two-partner secretion domain-containing protein, partial [Buttiauxella brennerae]|uniref:two-partner secretion domain-containing protein n=1 Tax=Buttiauxella brennerae TaxID=82988 RepID=UPI00286F22EC